MVFPGYASRQVFGLHFMHKPRVYSTEVLVPVVEHRLAERLMPMCPFRLKFVVRLGRVDSYDVV